jgi:hypothetical protein
MPDFGIFRGFNDKLFGDKLVAGQLPTQLGLIGSSDFGFDPDAQAFFDRVIAAGGSLSATEQLAVDTLVKQMKLDGTWTPMKAIYPMVGASAAACAQNLKSSSFTGTFTSGWTFASTGVTGNGTSAYADTSINLSTQISLFNVHYSLYSRTNNQNGIDMGVTDSGSLFSKEGWMLLRDGSNLFLGGFYNNAGGPGSISASNTDSRGFFISSALASNNIFIQKNSSVAGTFTGSNTSVPANTTIYYGAIHNATTNTGILNSDREYSFCSIGDGLTTTQASNFYTAVQAFQTTLSRQV